MFSLVLQPGAVGITEVDGVAGGDREVGVGGHFAALIPGEVRRSSMGMLLIVAGEGGRALVRRRARRAARRASRSGWSARRGCRSLTVPLRPMIRSPSQWPGTARSSTSAGRSAIITLFVIGPRSPRASASSVRPAMGPTAAHTRRALCVGRPALHEQRSDRSSRATPASPRRRGTRGSAWPHLLRYQRSCRPLVTNTANARRCSNTCLFGLEPARGSPSAAPRPIASRRRRCAHLPRHRRGDHPTPPIYERPAAPRRREISSRSSDDNCFGSILPRFHIPSASPSAIRPARITLHHHRHAHRSATTDHGSPRRTQPNAALTASGIPLPQPPYRPIRHLPTKAFTHRLKRRDICGDTARGRCARAGDHAAS